MHSEVYRIHIKNLARVFHTKQGDIPAIQNIDLKIKDGEFFSIVGPSGCGNAQPFQGQHRFTPVQRIDS